MPSELEYTEFISARKTESNSVPEKVESVTFGAMKWHERMNAEMRKRGWSVPDLADAIAPGWRHNDAALADRLYKYTKGKVENPRGRTVEAIAHAFNMPIAELRGEVTLTKDEAPAVEQNARLLGGVTLQHKIPVYGHAMGGKDGQFVLNGNKIADVLAPPGLENVKDAYGAYVAGDSMAPRYYAGEAVFVHPGLPVRKFDFVIAQVGGDEHGPPDAYIKQFITLDANWLKLAQFNPKKTLRFPAREVRTVHRIVASSAL